MLASNYFKVDTNVDLNRNTLKMLVFFYTPLVGNDSLFLYEFLALKGSSSFDKLSKLLNSLNINIDVFEKDIDLLNEFKLIKTLKNEEDKYVFIINEPLSFEEFTNDSILVRNFILKTSGDYYKSLISNNLFYKENYSGYTDISKKLDLNNLKDWNNYNESYLNENIDNENYGTIFDINKFLSNVSVNLFPLSFRTKDNLKEISKMADLYNISYEKMKRFIPQIIKSGSNEMDKNKLKTLCLANVSENVDIDDGNYNVPCVNYMQKLMNGKELTPFDKKVLYSLAHEYDLSHDVINVIIEHALKCCDGRLIEKFYLPIASDFYRNNIKNANDALNRLNNYNISKDHTIKYDSSNNASYDPEKLKEILNNRGSND